MILRVLIITFIYCISACAQDSIESDDFKFDPTYAIWVKLPEGVSFEPNYPPDSLDFQKSVQIDLDSDGIPENL